MTGSRLEHVNISVSNAAATAAWLQEVFGWHIRWEGDSIAGGHSKHVGGTDHYVVAYQAPTPTHETEHSYSEVGALNHVGVVVDDLSVTEARVKAAGFTPFNHGDYEPGTRFYFLDADGIEWEVVCYA